MQKKDSNNLLEPASAVAEYFDKLLYEIATESITERPVELKEHVVLLPEIESDLTNIEKELDSTEQEQYLGIEPDVDVQPQQGVGPPEQKTQDYDYPIECLMFWVGHHQLSIPLIDMGSVVPWVDHLTRLPHSPNWFLGLLNYRDKNVRVADSAGILNIHTVQHDNNNHILVFGDEGWAITCDQLGDVIQLQQQDVKWSDPRGEGFSMGTIKQSLAILLDPNKILNKLNHQDNLLTGDVEK